MSFWCRDLKHLFYTTSITVQIVAIWLLDVILSKFHHSRHSLILFSSPLHRLCGRFSILYLLLVSLIRVTQFTVLFFITDNNYNIPRHAGRTLLFCILTLKIAPGFIIEPESCPKRLSECARDQQNKVHQTLIQYKPVTEEYYIYKVHPGIGHEGPERGYRYSSTFSLISAMHGVWWLTPRFSRFTPGKETRYPLYRRHNTLHLQLS